MGSSSRSSKAQEKIRPRRSAVPTALQLSGELTRRRQHPLQRHLPSVRVHAHLRRAVPSHRAALCVELLVHGVPNLFTALHSPPHRRQVAREVALLLAEQPPL